MSSLEYLSGGLDTPMGSLDGGWREIRFRKDADLKVPFVFVTNRRLIFHCLRAVYTMIKYKKPGYNMAVIVYVSGDFGAPDGNIPTECRFLDSMDPECAFRMSFFPKDILERLKRMNNLTKRLPWTCGRWFVPHLVRGVDAAFYVDSDMMFIGDVVDLLKKNGIRLNKDIPIVSGASDECSDGNTFPVYYRNAGFLLLNVPKCLEDGFTEKLESEMPKYQYGCLDQECLNSVYKEELAKLKLPKYVNFTITRFGDISYWNERKIVGLHFTGEKKYGYSGFESKSPFSHRFIAESWIYESEIERFKDDPCSNGSATVVSSESVPVGERRLSVVIETSDRTARACAAILSLLKNLKFTGAVKYFIACNGSVPSHVKAIDRMFDIAGAGVEHEFVESDSDSFKKAMDLALWFGDVVLRMSDEWYLHREYSLDGHYDVVSFNEVVERIRLGNFSADPEVEGTFWGNGYDRIVSQDTGPSEDVALVHRRAYGTNEGLVRLWPSDLPKRELCSPGLAFIKVSGTDEEHPCPAEFKFLDDRDSDRYARCFFGGEEIEFFDHLVHVAPDQICP